MVSKVGDKKSQSAVEYLITYSWAILIIVIAIVLIYYFVLLPRTIVPGGCNFSGGAQCQSVILGSTGTTTTAGATRVLVYLTNTQTYAILNPTLNISVNNGANSTAACSPTYATAGGSIICSVTLNSITTTVGQLFTGNMWLSGLYCGVGNNPYNQTLCASAPKEIYSGDFYGHTQTAITPTYYVALFLANNAPMVGTSDKLTAKVSFVVGAITYPLAGATVNFTTNQLYATTSPQYADTNSSGYATSYAHSTSAGAVVITAGFSGITSNNTINWMAPITTTTSILTTTVLTTTVPTSSNTIVSCSPASFAASGTTTCTATVTGHSPTGTVSFTTSDGTGLYTGSPCTLSAGSCNVIYTDTAVGAPTLTATYSGDSSNLGSSGTTVVTVGKAASITLVSCTPTSFVVSGSTTCTASVSGDSPTNTVSFATTSGTGSYTGSPCTLSAGSCNVVYSDTTAGSQTLTATYSGDVNNAGSFGNTIVTVGKAASTTSVSCAPTSFAEGGTTTCTATVTGSSPTNTVSFTTTSGTGSYTGSPCTLSSGSCSATYTDTTAGSPTLTATYSGDASNGGSSGMTSVTVTVTQCSPSGSGQTVCPGDVVFACGTTRLYGNVYAMNSIFIPSCATVDTYGYDFIANYVFNNQGTINTEQNGAGGQGGYYYYGCYGGTGYGSSYGGGGGGGGGGNSAGGDAYGGCSGGATVGSGSSPGGGVSSQPGYYGNSASNPTVTNAAITTWFSCGIPCFEGAGGGGGGQGTYSTDDGGNAGNGGYGIYIQGTQVTAGTINAWGSAGQCYFEYGGGGGGGGGGWILLAYATTLIPGTYSTGGGSSCDYYAGLGGQGGSGKVSVYMYTTQPIAP